MRALRVVTIIFGVVVLAFLAYGFVATQTPDGRERSAERQVIRDCREKIVASNTPGMDRSVASVCERMEADYRTKWRRDP